MGDLSHLNEKGELSMVDVGEKEETRRQATARAIIRMTPETLGKAMKGELPKGDVLTTARVAGILSAKQTPFLIPLTHPLAISFVGIEFATDAGAGTITIDATVRCDGRTGVEIEAMTACSVAALTIYDMCKSAEKGIVIESVRLLQKSGGKSGEYHVDPELRPPVSKT